MNTKALLLVFVVLFASVFAHDHGHGHDDHDHDDELGTAAASAVIDLDFSTFHNFIKSNDFVFVEFYAPWCGHCKMLAPIWEQLAQTLKDSPVKVAKVDAAKDTLLAQEFEIQGFPTLKLFRRGLPVDYDGARDLNALSSWALRKTSPPVQQLSADAAKAFSHGFLGTFSEEGRKAFTAAATEIEFDGWQFGEVSAEVAKELGLNVDEPRFYSDLQSEPVSFAITGESTTQDFMSKLCRYGYAAGDEISQAVYQRLEQCGRPFVIYFYKTVEEGKAFVDSVSDFAGKVGVSVGDGVRWKDIISRLGGTGNVVPTVVAFIEKKGEPVNVAWDEEKPLTAESVKEWLKEVVEGTAKSFLKSEPIPENNDGPVTVLVGKNFVEIVNDNTKDVLVEYYAPWCPHCKNLEPIYESLGQIFKDAPSVVISKIDATANSIPDDISISGFPTIHFFPANNKAEPIPYEGPRTARAIAEFIKTHAATTFEIELSALPEDNTAPLHDEDEEEEEEPEEEEEEGDDE